MQAVIIRVLGESRSLVPEGRVFRDEFEKLAVHVYQVELSPSER